MESLNQRTEIIDKAGVYNQIYQDKKWNADVMEAKSFVDITKSGLSLQFKRAIMDPYQAMLDHRDATPNPTPNPTPKPIPSPTPKPTGLKFVN